MPGTSHWIIDKSALVRLGGSPDDSVWAGRIARGMVRLSTITRLEIGFSARSGGQLREATASAPLASMPIEYMTPAIEERACAVQQMLADLGHHRAASIPDLLVAATAELVGLTVLHVDKDFELIAEVTSQSVERLRLPT